MIAQIKARGVKGCSVFDWKQLALFCGKIALQVSESGVLFFFFTCLGIGWNSSLKWTYLFSISSLQWVSKGNTAQCILSLWNKKEADWWLNPISIAVSWTIEKLNPINASGRFVSGYRTDLVYHLKTKERHKRYTDIVFNRHHWWNVTVPVNWSKGKSNWEWSI